MARNAEWRIEGERNGKILKLALINKVPATEAASASAMDMVTSTSSCKGRRQCMKLPSAVAGPADQLPPASLRHQGLLETLRRMGAPHPTCVLQKRLTNSDIDGGQNRLQLQREGVRKSALYGMLNQEEKAAVEGGIGVKVRVFDPVGREHSMTFLFYPRSVKQYRFIGPEYGKLVRENRWQSGQTLDLWVSRLRGNGGDDGQGELVVAMLNHGEEDEEKEQETALGSQVSDDQGLYWSGLTPYEKEAVEILAQMRKAAF